MQKKSHNTEMTVLFSNMGNVSLPQIMHDKKLKLLRKKADELIYKFMPSDVAVDLSGIEFMDSSGLGFIMGRYALQKKLGGNVTLKDPGARVNKIIALAGLERIIKIERTKKK